MSIDLTMEGIAAGFTLMAGLTLGFGSALAGVLNLMSFSGLLMAGGSLMSFVVIERVSCGSAAMERGLIIGFCVGVYLGLTLLVIGAMHAPPII